MTTTTAIEAPEFDLEIVPEADRERVAALIPDPRLAERYVHRNIGSMQDFLLLDYAIAKSKNVILAGPTGSSKTTFFRAYAAWRRLPFALVECNGAMDPGTVLGRTTIAPDGSVRWVDGDMTLAVRYGGVILYDEVNMAHARITAASHQLFAVTRRMSVPEAGETIRAGCGGEGDPQPILLGAAYNPRYQGTVRLNEAFSNRFALPIDWDYDREVEQQLVTSGRLLDMAAHLRGLADIRTPVSTNSLQEFEEHAVDLGIDLAQYFFLNRFPSEERTAVGRALEAHSAAIAYELNI